MKIVTLEQLKQMPVGTMFAEVNGHDQLDDPSNWPLIITNKVEGGWLGSISLFPQIEEVDGKLYSQVFSFDDSHADYYSDQLFIVWSKQDIKNTIEWLLFALSGGKADFDDQKWWNEDGTAYKTDEEMEGYL